MKLATCAWDGASLAPDARRRLIAQMYELLVALLRTEKPDWKFSCPALGIYSQEVLGAEF